MSGSLSPPELHAVLHKPKCPVAILGGEGLTLEQPGQGGAVRDEGK